MMAHAIVDFSLPEIGMAYRKAKVDAFYSSIPVRSLFLEYEKDLLNNLLRFQEQLRIKPYEIDLGTWILMPKSMRFEKEDSCFICADPKEHWKDLCEARKIKAEFRIMAKPSVDFYLLSSLWVNTAGHKYDATLSNSACGNRLRRKNNQDINPLSLGSFVPYLRPFTKWRDSGIKIMREALEKKKKIIAITADIGSYYHELKPDFMLDNVFLAKIGVELSPAEKDLTNIFISSLEKWTSNTPLKKGLPVGLPASSIIGNMALCELDMAMEQEIVPLYYGRYVDDIILVMENNFRFKNPEQLWEWIFTRTHGLLRWENEQKKNAVSFVPAYLEGSKIQFDNSKNKVFVLDGKSGLSLIESIDRQIHERASEWRALPCIPEKPEYIATDLLVATQSDGECADNLRKTSTLSVRRAGFAIKLRDFEAYTRDLEPLSWKKIRHAFFDAVIEHVLVLPIFFDLYIYLSRVLQMATTCSDFYHLKMMILQLEELSRNVREKCSIGIKSCADEDCPSPYEILDKWDENLVYTVKESIKASFPSRLSKEAKKDWKKHFEDGHIIQTYDLSLKSLQSAQRDLFMHDLAELPFRFIGMPKELVGSRVFAPKKDIVYLKEASLILNEVVTEGIYLLQQWMNISRKIGLPYGLLFSTRPFNVQELYLLHKEPFEESSQEALSKVLLAVRGFCIKGQIPVKQKNGTINIPQNYVSAKQRIALTSWKTKTSSWMAAVMKQPDPDVGRYQRLNNLVNSILSSPSKPAYVILPELSMPAIWFIRTALKLLGKGISLICGVEYLHRRGKKVCNQVWAALTHNAFGFPSLVIFRQDKQRPAIHEEQELYRLAGLKLIAQSAWMTPPIIRHGNIQFSMLICSELTNITYRAALRGCIDALFVPEWNQDTETFNSLVETSAVDIHSYIIQCNDRQYGDSRIRAPFKDSWKRDSVRIKGGIEDYFVIGEIDIVSLRAFQSSFRSPSGPFKPVPDGFKIDKDRIELPQTDDTGE